ncbi:hypothetical protein BDN72DRAFT_860317 [Pluteus cervinus]|uniref:Uncharacterized protein n=1 Tax=Pluteus cervinus TaxID=181527 RepID=A0ACD3ALT6_9AGAR|nr:hypothetical protein BDN72DRAFT_860317 [Pluteus cervinus]
MPVFASPPPEGNIRDSSTFKKFPWAVRDLSDWLPAKPEAYYGAIDSFERPPDGRDGIWITLQSGALFRHHVGLPNGGTAESKLSWCIVVAWLAAYRLLDVITLRESPNACPTREAYPTCAYQTGIPKWEREFADLDDFLDLACDSITSKDFEEQAEASSDSTMTIPVRLLSYIAGKAVDGRAVAIRENFATAAFHLHYLLLGHMDLKSDEISRLIESLKSNEAKHVKQRFQNPNAWRNALTVSLLFTPLLLLYPFALANNLGYRGRMFESWKSSDALKPGEITEIESLIWGTLFSVARGKETVDDGLVKLAHRISSLPRLTRWKDYFVHNPEIVTPAPVPSSHNGSASVPVAAIRAATLSGSSIQSNFTMPPLKNQPTSKRTRSRLQEDDRDAGENGQPSRKKNRSDEQSEEEEIRRQLHQDDHEDGSCPEHQSVPVEPEEDQDGSSDDNKRETERQAAAEEDSKEEDDDNAGAERRIHRPTCIALHRQFLSSRKPDLMSMRRWIVHQTQSMVLQLKLAGRDVDDEEKILAVTMGLPPSYDALVRDLDNTPELSLNHVITCLIDEERQQAENFQ